MAADPRQWESLVRKTCAPGESIRWRDGVVGCITDDGKSVVTSPNMSFIPRPTYGNIWISIKADGHYGTADPTLWPQVLVEKSRFPWLAAVSRRPSHPDDAHLRIMWMPLSLTDFVPLEDHMQHVHGNVQVLGTVHRRQRDGFEPLVNNVLRKLTQHVRRHGYNREVDSLVTSMQDAYDRLSYPATYRDLVRQYACVQRYWRMANAWFEWNTEVTGNHASNDLQRPCDRVRKDLIGAFTTSPVIAKRLFDLRMPVWFARTVDHLSWDDVIQAFVDFDRPTDITIDEGIFKDAQGLLGLAGSAAHLNFIMTNGHHYADLEATLMPAPNSFRPSTSFDSTIQSRAITTPSSSYGVALRGVETVPVVLTTAVKQPSHDPGNLNSRSHARGLTSAEREKFQPFIHPLMPSSIPIWECALASVDLSTPSSSGDNVWKFWFPEPRLVISSSVPDRQTRYLMNWLRVRVAWLYIVTNRSMQDGIVGPLKAPEWREYLNSSSLSQQALPGLINSKKNQRKKDVSAIFQLVLGVRDILDIPVPSKWFDRSLQGCSIAEATICHRQIVWELCEVAFRYELQQLDRYLVTIDAIDYERLLVEQDRRRLIAAVFPHDFVLSSLPTGIEGLAALDVSSRIPYLAALQKVLSRWPAAPGDVKGPSIYVYASSGMRVEKTERQMAEFYCQTFYQVAGRAPVLPRRFPVA
ncbi:hypothetical protein EW026_g3864 [Hermanssonia centrifuga]|uniref:Uncharacterized protein n=2 Tax=Hermanssonia centrifuga TaxID=98765 RepID=A0A4S4KK39_9APHY|nr:hypothetical protein PHLCEN_2v12627 [Hermanssonia centrifuga]THG98300.1 hypothetical protein EW026_g3864 [Hermanssonia centrifuga]